MRCNFFRFIEKLLKTRLLNLPSRSFPNNVISRPNLCISFLLSTTTIVMKENSVFMIAK